MQALTFKKALTFRPAPRGIDVSCKLKHFAIITYAIDPARLDKIIPERFALDTVCIDGKDKALISVVPFEDVDFTSAVYPFPKFTMGQTNYRIYIIDKVTNERCVWFLGTSLDSWTVAVPRLLWNLPWYKASIKFDCLIDAQTGRYEDYKMQTTSDWAPASVVLSQAKNIETKLDGFSDTESGLVYLTHPLAGFYHRRDGKLGTYRVWHKRLEVSFAKLESANFGLLTRLNLVSLQEQQQPHSVLIEPLNEFTIYLPPQTVA